jgi:hypothetical protein
MRFFAFIFSVVAGLLVAALAAAQVAPGYQPGLPAVPAAPVGRALPASQWTALQIRQSFELADTDSNGELTRAESQQLAIMPRSFEEMDENKDGVVARIEYVNVFAR